MPPHDATPTVQELAALEALFSGMDRYFSESGERHRFMRAAHGLVDSDLHLLQSVLGGSLKADAALSGAASAHSPLRIANALLELETTVRKTKDRVLLDFIFALLQAPKVADGLGRLWVFPWEQALVLNKQLTAEQLRFIWQTRQAAYAKELVPDSARLLAKHPHCPPDVLAALLPRDDAMLRKTIAMHPQISPDIARFFLNSPRKPERLNLALSRHASSGMLLSLLRDKHSEVSQAARKNLAQRFPAVQATEEAVQAAVHAWIAKPHAAPTAPGKPAFNARDAERAGHDSVLALEPAQRKRVADATMDAELLARLARDSSKPVRRAVARRGTASLEVLKALARDSDTETSNNAMRGVVHFSPQVTAEELLTPEAIDAAYRDIARHVASNSQADADEGFTAQEKLDYARALLVAEHTSNPLIQRMLVKDLKAIPPAHTPRWDLLAATAANRHLCDAVSRTIIAELGFGGFEPLRRCRSAPLLRELLATGAVEPHYHSTIRDRLDELAAQGAGD